MMKKNDTCNLDQELTGYELTEEFCINLVRDCWDCSKGASWATTPYG
ncbi:MAG: hypothetical protein LBP85_09745 [Prevotellaceae bacterium]|nr:hypothetical protein [Prevotellaceae bacterium]